MHALPTRCLILACGNSLRSDDGVGLALCAWAEKRFATEQHVRAVACQQWTPELAEDVAGAESVIFIDCSAEAGPGIVQLTDVQPAPSHDAGKHHLDGAALLAITQQLYGRAPYKAWQLTVGAACLDLGEQLSPEVEAALPNARSLLELTVGFLLQPEVQRA